MAPFVECDVRDTLKGAFDAEKVLGDSGDVVRPEDPVDETSNVSKERRLRALPQKWNDDRRPSAPRLHIRGATSIAAHL